MVGATGGCWYDGAMQEMPDHDWVVEEAEALLAADPELRASIERQLAEHRAGTLKTTPDEQVRAEEVAARRRQTSPR